ncbi:MAG: GNAT family N-acetyltransferase [Acetobacteraceae bacterium]
MPDGTAALSLTLHARIADIPAPEWDGCAGDANPFVSHAFLSALEDSGSATARTGWLPQHAVLRDAAGGIVGVAPMYAKSHSYGEYVFDHGWAHAFERAGGAYYPKLQVGVPFSPVPGPRLLLRRAAGTAPPLAAMAAALEAACRQLDLSSVHVTFCNQAEWNALGAAGWLQRTGMQFHWQNDGYATFEDFLSALSSRKRKIIRRERRDAARGLRLRVLCGREIEPRHWQSFYAFYTSTVDRKWGSAYLTRRFFPLLAERLAERVVLMLAEQNGEPVAAALNLMGRDTLYGRNWGCRGEWPFLHFELCYYQAIEFAIAHGLQRVEAGAQGQHKLQRGYLPACTYSAHWIAHPGLRRAIADFLRYERVETSADMAALAEHSPFRAGEP